MLTKLRDFWNISNQTHSVRRGAAAARAAAAARQERRRRPPWPVAFRLARRLSGPSCCASASQNITQEMRSDPDVVAVRSGGMPSRLARTKTGAGLAAPAPSLGCVGRGPGLLGMLSLRCTHRHAAVPRAGGRMRGPFLRTRLQLPPVRAPARAYAPREAPAPQGRCALAAAAPAAAPAL